MGFNILCACFRFILAFPFLLFFIKISSCQLILNNIVANSFYLSWLFTIYRKKNNLFSTQQLYQIVNPNSTSLFVLSRLFNDV